MGVIVGLGFGWWVCKFAYQFMIAHFPFRTLVWSGGVVLGMCFVMILLYDVVYWCLGV